MPAPRAAEKPADPREQQTALPRSLPPPTTTNPTGTPKPRGRSLYLQMSPHPRSTRRPRHPGPTELRPEVRHRAWTPVDAAAQPPDQQYRAPTGPHPNGRQQNRALPSSEPSATGDTPPPPKSNYFSTVTNSEHYGYDTAQERLFDNSSCRGRPGMAVYGGAGGSGVSVVVVVVVVDPAVHPDSTHDVVPGAYPR